MFLGDDVALVQVQSRTAGGDLEGGVLVGLKEGFYLFFREVGGA
jgi:hypothetical protein